MDVLDCTKPHALGRARGDEEVIQLTAPHPLQTHKWKCQNERSISLSNIVRLVVGFFLLLPQFRGRKARHLKKLHYNSEIFNFAISKL